MYYQLMRSKINKRMTDDDLIAKKIIPQIFMSIKAFCARLAFILPLVQVLLLVDI